MAAKPYAMSDLRDDAPTVQLHLTCAVDLNANTATGEPTFLLTLPTPEGFEPSRELNTVPHVGGAIHWKGLIFTIIGESLQISHERNDAEALMAFDFVLGEELTGVRREFTAKSLEAARRTNGTSLSSLEITASHLHTIRVVIRLFYINIDVWRNTEWLITDTP